jgi:hypothetical protein
MIKLFSTRQIDGNPGFEFRIVHVTIT